MSQIEVVLLAHPVERVMALVDSSYGIHLADYYSSPEFKAAVQSRLDAEKNTKHPNPDAVFRMSTLLNELEVGIIKVREYNPKRHFV